jgi:hypothetical protein
MRGDLGRRLATAFRAALPGSKVECSSLFLSGKTRLSASPHNVHETGVSPPSTVWIPWGPESGSGSHKGGWTVIWDNPPP